MRCGRIDGVAEAFDDGVHNRRIDDEGRRQQHMIAAHPVNRTAHGIDHQPARHGLSLHLRMQLVLRRERLLAPPIGNQLDRLKKPAPAHVSDERVIAKSLLEPSRKLSALRAHVREQPVALYHALHRQRRGAGERMTHIGVTVLKSAGTLGNRIEDFVLHEERADRRITAAEPLCDRHEIGRNSFLLARVQRTRAPHAAHDLVENQQDTMAVADFPYPLKIAGNRGHRTQGGANHGLGNKGHDVLAAELPDLCIELLGQPFGVSLRGLLRAPLAIFEHRRYMVRLEQQRSELLALLFPSADRQRAQGYAVIALAARNDVSPLRLPKLDKILPRQLERGLDCLRSAAHEEDTTDTFRRARDQLVGELFGYISREEARMCVSQTVELLAHRGEHVRMRMSQAGDRRPAGSIDILASGRIADDDALSLRGDRIGVTGLTMKNVSHGAALYINSRSSGAGLTRLRSCLTRRAGASLIRRHTRRLEQRKSVPAMGWRIGIDIGGTFTDVALVDDASGDIGVAKVPTTPGDLTRGVLDALDAAMRRYEVAPGGVDHLSHATTVVTNAILQECGSRAALITTRGFRDVLELRRSARANLYDLFQDAPATLIPRRLRFEITERVGADGAVVTPLAEAEIDGLIAALGAARVEAVAVSFLFSFLNPQHERKLGERLGAALPHVPIYLSCDVLPEIKEFERSSTTAVCAYVGPILASYLKRLEEATRTAGLPALHLMGSNGGILESREAIAMPAVAVESGPAAGVVAAALLARQSGRPDLLSFDMGGTTAKASLIRGGHYETTPDYEVGGGPSMSRWMTGTGHPIRMPVIDLAEVSAGGGSIAWVDRAGALRVGPQSAGADPGPVCYGRGGSEPTVTDCDLLLGYLDKKSLLGGDLAIDHAAANAAVGKHLADPLGVDVRTAAAAVIDIVNHSMAEVLKIVSVQRGHDPRDFALAAFGGAGPLHAAALATELGISEIICPPIPGAFSALGLVGSELKRDYVRTLHRAPGSSDAAGLPDSVEAAFRVLEREGAAMLDRAGIPAERRRLDRSVDARYARQSFELAIPASRRPVDEIALTEISERFHERHLQTYGHNNRSEPVQIVSVRVAAIGAIPPLSIRDRPAPAGTDALKSKRALWFRETALVDAAIYDRARMPAGYAVRGPAVIESLDSTILVPPGWKADMSEDGFVLLSLGKDP